MITFVPLARAPEEASRAAPLAIAPTLSCAVHVGLRALSSPGLPGRLNKSRLTDSRTLTSSFTNGETHKEADSRMDVFSGRMAAMVAINQGKSSAGCRILRAEGGPWSVVMLTLHAQSLSGN